MISAQQWKDIGGKTLPLLKAAVSFQEAPLIAIADTPMLYKKLCEDFGINEWVIHSAHA